MQALRFSVVLVGFLCCFAFQAFADSPYRMEGTVTDAETNQPVAGARVQVLIAFGHRNPKERLRTAISDANGRYAVELPAGHAMALNVLPPPGYYMADPASAMQSFAVTKESPVFRKNFAVAKGFPIRVEVPEAGLTKKGDEVTVSIHQMRDDSFVGATTFLDEDGKGALTLPRLDGEFTIGCADWKQTLICPHEMTATFAEGFDPRDVAPDVQRGKNGEVVLRDAEGRTATLKGCDAKVREKQLVIVIEARAATEEDLAAFVKGRVVDSKGNGIEAASIKLVYSSKGGGSWLSEIATTTAKDGGFIIGVPKIATDDQISLMVTRDGYAGVDTPPKQIAAAKSGIIDVGAISLGAESTIRIRAVGPDNEPLHGALIEPQGSYATSARFARTDENGECVLSGLASGVNKLSAQFGDLVLHTNVVVEPGENDLTTLRLAPFKAVEANVAQTPAKREPLAIGTAAPEWSIGAWTDGGERKLSDFKGKVVVIDFWGIWCGPCIQAIPAMKELQHRFADKGVVFVGIHTGETDVETVEKFIKTKEWDALIGVESRKESQNGDTSKKYAVQFYPTVFVIDRDGAVVYNGGDQKHETASLTVMEGIAKEMKIAWPPADDLAKEQVIELSNRTMVAIYSREIEKALAK